MEPNIHLQHSCLLLLTVALPGFLFSPSYFCLILTNWLLVLPVSGSLPVAPCTGPPPAEFVANTATCGSSSSWRQESQSQTQQGCPDELGCGSITFNYLNSMCLRDFLAKYTHIPHPTWGLFGHTLLLEVMGTSVSCHSSPDLIFFSPSFPCYPLGKPRSRSSWHGGRAKPRGAGVGAPASTCSSSSAPRTSDQIRSAPLGQQRRLRALLPQPDRARRCPGGVAVAGFEWNVRNVWCD